MGTLPLLVILAIVLMLVYAISRNTVVGYLLGVVMALVAVFGLMLLASAL